ncbi:MAG TPA: DUF4252 domain-containing protein [Saprospiraceae bacterium]|nr:DUF4252 domain-containing protein [Saprospiraceae bacterium]
MKAIRLIIAGILLATGLHAQDYGLYWKYKDYDGGIAVSIPRWATFVGSAFMDEKEERQLVRKIHKARVLFFEDGSPFSQRDLKKFHRKARRRHLDELVTVRSGKTHVSVLAKSRRSTIRKVVVLFSSEEGAGLVTVKGNFNLNEINRVIEKSSKGNKKDKEFSIPNLPKVPVKRT